MRSPWVAARYFGVCNGPHLVFYDVRSIDQDYQPVLSLETQELTSRFEELVDLIGPKSLVRHLKRRVLDDTRAILSAEVREEHLDTFQRDIRAVLSEVKPIVRENAKAVRARRTPSRIEHWRRLREKVSLNSS